MKSNFIRERDNIKNKKKIKYKGKVYKGENRNYLRDSDNIVSIYDFKNIKEEEGIENRDIYLQNQNGDNEITKIKKLTKKKKINENDYTDTLTTRKEYKLHKTSTISVPIKK